MLIEQICRYLVSEIVKDDRTSSLRRICNLLNQLEPRQGSAPSSGSREEGMAVKTHSKFVYVENPLIGLTPDSSALLSSPHLTFPHIYAAFESSNFSTLIDTKTYPIDPNGPILPILLVMLYLKSLRATPEHTFAIYQTMLTAKDQKGDYGWKGRNGRVKLETMIVAMMDRRLRFGGMNQTKVDMWFNEMFETGELRWIEQKNKAQEVVEAEIWGVGPNADYTTALSSPNPLPTSSRILADRSERRLRPLMECFDRIRHFSGISDKIVLSNLNFLLIDKQAIPEEIMNEENVKTLLGLVRHYTENLPVKAGPYSKSENASQEGKPNANNETSFQDGEGKIEPIPSDTAFTPSNALDASSSSIDSQKSASSSSLLDELGNSTKFGSEMVELTRDAIVESVLKILSRWCKYGSPRWTRPSQAYLVKPKPWEVNQEEAPETTVDLSAIHIRTTRILKKMSMAILTEYILKILHSAPTNPRLTTRCFMALAYSTIVLKSPEKDIPTQIFIHYMHYGPLTIMNRSLYWELIDAGATLMRQSSLDPFLEMANLVIRSWDNVGLSFDNRPPFEVPIPPEAQHLPPSTLMNPPTRLHVSPGMATPGRDKMMEKDEVEAMPTGETPVINSTLRKPQVVLPGEPRKGLPPLQNQRDVFSLFRMVVLWRRFDQGWTEQADDEIQALALTIQYNYVNGTPTTQVMSLMAAMGVLDALVQSKCLANHYTIMVFYNILTHATMRVARNEGEIAEDWRCWRQSIAMIVSSFNESFPNLDDTLLLQIVTDVLLEDAMNVEYLFKSDPQPETIAQTMKKIESQKSSFLFRLLPLLSHSLSSLFCHTNNASLHDAIMYKLHSFSVRLHQLWRVYQPKFRAMHSSLQKQKQGNGSAAPTKDQSGGGVEKAAKSILDQFFKTYVAIFDEIMMKLSYRQITRAIEALGFLEFACSTETEEGPYAELLEKLLDRFHAMRPADNWVSQFLNLGLMTLFGGAPHGTRENALQLDKPSLIRVKQYLAVVQHTCAKYPNLFNRVLLEQRGLLALLFWMVECPYKTVNRKAHRTFTCFFLQKNLLLNEPYLGEGIELMQPSNTSKSAGNSLNQNADRHTALTPSAASSVDKGGEKTLSKAMREKSQPSKKSKKEKPVTVSETILYEPQTFTEEILPYYWKLTLETYPEKTRGDSILLNLTVLLGGALPPESPLIPFILVTLMKKLSSLRFSKTAAELTKIALGLIGIVPHACLPALLQLLQDYVLQCPRGLQRLLCATLLDSIAKNQDYSRKEICTNWYMHLVNSLGFHSKL